MHPCFRSSINQKKSQECGIENEGKKETNNSISNWIDEDLIEMGIAWFSQ